MSQYITNNDLLKLARERAVMEAVKKGMVDITNKEDVTKLRKSIPKVHAQIPIIDASLLKMYPA